MANLENKRIKDTYEGLIKTDDNNAISGEVELTDGAGNGTGVSVSTDGRVVASGTVSFGSLKDTGENITITKFVDEADGIANNDNDTSIPTVAAVKDYVDSTELDTVTSVNTQTGDVVLDTDDISEGTSNLYYTEARVSANTSVAANTLKNTYPSADATKVGYITVTQAVDLDTLESNVATNNAKTGITTQQAADITMNNAKVGITTTQANAITTNSAKVSFPEAPNDGDSYVRKNEGWVSLTHPADAVTSVNGETGAVVLDTDDINEGTSNLYYTDARVSANSAVAANTAKVGITTAQADAITANTAKNSYPSADATKVGHISVTQAVDLDTMESNIATNNAKNSYPSADATKVGFISVTQAVDLDTIESDVATNNAKVGITTEQANAITANTAKVGITTQQANDITANNAKVGITTQQANDITANNAKISFDSASSTKLAGIETGADVTDTANVTAAGALMDSEVDADIKTLSLPANTTISSFAQSFLDDADAATVRATIGAGTSDFDGAYSSLTGTPTIPTNNNELTNGAGYITDGNTGWDNSYGFITASSTDTLTNKSGNISQWTNDAGYTTNVGTVTEVTVGTALGVTSGTSTPNITLDTANLYKVIGIATDHSSRVTLDNGTSEGATSIMQNFETLIFN